MNQPRVLKLLQELAAAQARVTALQLELADAVGQTEQRRPQKRRVAAPGVEVSQEAKDAARRALRKAGVAA